MGLSFRASVAPDAQVNTADDHTGPDHRASAGNRARVCTAFWVSAAYDSIPPGHLGSRRWPHGSTKPLEAFPQAAQKHLATDARTRRVPSAYCNGQNGSESIQGIQIRLKTLLVLVLWFLPEPSSHQAKSSREIKNT